MNGFTLWFCDWCNIWHPRSCMWMLILLPSNPRYYIQNLLIRNSFIQESNRCMPENRNSHITPCKALLFEDFQHFLATRWDLWRADSPIPEFWFLSTKLQSNLQIASLARPLCGTVLNECYAVLCSDGKALVIEKGGVGGGGGWALASEAIFFTQKRWLIR